MKTLGLVLIAAIFLMACSNELKEKKEALYKEVMAAHDEVMPKIGDLNKLAKELTAKADSLVIDESDSSARVQELRMAIKELESADNGMMEWMRQFKQPDNEAPLVEAVAYLSEQKDKIEKVKSDMLNSLAKAERLQQE